MDGMIYELLMPYMDVWMCLCKFFFLVKPFLTRPNHGTVPSSSEYPSRPGAEGESPTKIISHLCTIHRGQPILVAHVAIIAFNSIVDYNWILNILMVFFNSSLLCFFCLSSLETSTNFFKTMAEAKPETPVVNHLFICLKAHNFKCIEKKNWNQNLFIILIVLPFSFFFLLPFFFFWNVCVFLKN